jgi:hypothetical protein
MGFTFEQHFNEAKSGIENMVVASEERGRGAVEEVGRNVVE